MVKKSLLLKSTEIERSAAFFVKEAKKYKSVIELSAAGKKADGKSIMDIFGLATAGLKKEEIIRLLEKENDFFGWTERVWEKGIPVTLAVSGPDEEEAMKAIERIIALEFPE